MRLPQVPSPGKIAGCSAGQPGAAAGETWLAILKTAPKTPTLIVIAVVAIAGVTPMIVETISKRLPAIIKAWSEARNLRHRRKMQNKLLQAVAEGKEDAKEEGRILSDVCLTPVTGAVGGRLGALAAAPGVLVGHCNV